MKSEPIVVHGVDAIAAACVGHGVAFLFTLCGGHISPILTACKARGLRVIDVRDEATAVFAADAVSRPTGLPGVAVVTACPGLTNTITALKNAQLAQSPVILLGGRNKRTFHFRPQALKGRDSSAFRRSPLQRSTRRRPPPLPGRWPGLCWVAPSGPRRHSQ
jgi:acetolactate synthase-1/2/3 large subunit